MPYQRPSNRSYTDREIGALIKRATELNDATEGSAERRLYLEDIEHMASDLGLSPESIRTAALEMENRPHSDRATNLFGGPFVVETGRIVDETITSEQWEQMVLELRAFTGKRGQVDTVGSAREWIHALGEGDEGFNFVKTRVVVRPRNGKTSIELRKYFGGTVVPIYMLASGVSIFIAFAAINAIPGPTTVALAAGGIVGALAVVRMFVKSWVGRQRVKFERLLDRIEWTQSRAFTAALASGAETERIEIPEMVEPEPTSAASRRVRG